MFTAVKETMEKHSSLFASHTSLLNSQGRLSALLGEMDTLGRSIQTATDGLVAQRKLKEQFLVGETLTLCSSLYALGEESGDGRLMALAIHTPSELHQMRKTELIQLVGGLCDAADEAQPALESYGYEPWQVDDLRALLDTYTTLVHAYRKAVSDRAGALVRMRQLARETTRLLRRRIDPAMRGFALTQPHFHAAYSVARRIVDLGIRHEEASGGTDAAAA